MSSTPAVYYKKPRSTPSEKMRANRKRKRDNNPSNTPPPGSDSDNKDLNNLPSTSTTSTVMYKKPRQTAAERMRAYRSRIREKREQEDSSNPAVAWIKMENPPLSDSLEPPTIRPATVDEPGYDSGTSTSAWSPANNQNTSYEISSDRLILEKTRQNAAARMRAYRLRKREQQKEQDLYNTATAWIDVENPLFQPDPLEISAVQPATVDESGNDSATSKSAWSPVNDQDTSHRISSNRLTLEQARQNAAARMRAYRARLREKRRREELHNTTAAWIEIENPPLSDILGMSAAEPTIATEPGNDSATSTSPGSLANNEGTSHQISSDRLTLEQARQNAAARMRAYRARLREKRRREELHNTTAAWIEIENPPVSDILEVSAGEPATIDETGDDFAQSTSAGFSSNYEDTSHQIFSNRLTHEKTRKNAEDPSNTEVAWIKMENPLSPDILEESAAEPASVDELRNDSVPLTSAASSANDEETLHQISSNWLTHEKTLQNAGDSFNTTPAWIEIENPPVSDIMELSAAEPATVDELENDSAPSPSSAENERALHNIFSNRWTLEKTQRNAAARMRAYRLRLSEERKREDSFNTAEIQTNMKNLSSGTVLGVSAAESAIVTEPGNDSATSTSARSTANNEGTSHQIYSNWLSQKKARQKAAERMRAYRSRLREKRKQENPYNTAAVWIKVENPSLSDIPEVSAAEPVTVDELGNDSAPAKCAGFSAKNKGTSHEISSNRWTIEKARQNAAARMRAYRLRLREKRKREDSSNNAASRTNMNNIPLETTLGESAAKPVIVIEPGHDSATSISVGSSANNEGTSHSISSNWLTHKKARQNAAARMRAYRSRLREKRMQEQLYNTTAAWIKTENPQLPDNLEASAAEPATVDELGNNSAPSTSAGAHRISSNQWTLQKFRQNAAAKMRAYRSRIREKRKQEDSANATTDWIKKENLPSSDILEATSDEPATVDELGNDSAPSTSAWSSANNEGTSHQIFSNRLTHMKTRQNAAARMRAYRLRVRQRRKQEDSLNTTADCIKIDNHPLSDILKASAAEPATADELGNDFTPSKSAGSLANNETTSDQLPCRGYNSNKNGLKLFEEQFTTNRCGYTCFVCDPPWFKNELQVLTENQQQALCNAFPDVDPAKFGRTGNGSDITLFTFNCQSVRAHVTDLNGKALRNATVLLFRQRDSNDQT